MFEFNYSNMVTSAQGHSLGTRKEASSKETRDMATHEIERRKGEEKARERES